MPIVISGTIIIIFLQVNIPGMFSNGMVNYDKLESISKRLYPMQ